MSQDEFLIGLLALTISFGSTAIAAGPWTSPYQIRSIANIEKRFGKRAARCAWLVIAILSGTCGLTILNGMRPSYAAPTIRLDQAR